MGLRPARTCRSLEKVSWARFSKKKPRKNFIKAMPHSSVQIFVMGNAQGNYDAKLELVADEPVQIRDNSLESARQAINKYLEKNLPGAYFLRVNVFPHNVIRENKMILGAGADRLQKGMRLAYGRPNDRGARVYAGSPIYTMLINSKNRKLADEAYRRAKLKLPGFFTVKVSPVKASVSPVKAS